MIKKLIEVYGQEAIDTLQANAIAAGKDVSDWTDFVEWVEMYLIESAKELFEEYEDEDEDE